MSLTGRALTVLAVSLGMLAAACASDPVAASQEHLRRGDAYLADNKPREAIIEYRNAVNRAPRSPMAYARLGAGYLAVNEGQNALEAFVRAADLNPKLVEAQLRAADLLLRAEAYEDARTRARAVLQEDPANVSALVVLGNALAGLQNFDEAIAANERAVELDPTQPGVRVNLGSLRLMRGNEKEAEQSFRNAVEVDPKSIDARVALASFFWLDRRLADAEREFKAAHAINPADLDANRAMATFYIASGRSPEAEGYLRTLANRTGTRDARIALSDFYLELGRHDEALQVLRGLNTPAEDIPLELRIARALRVSGRTEEAAADIEAILRRHPANPAALAFKAQLLVQNGRWSEALTIADLAVAADARSLQGQFARAVALRAGGRLDEARKALAVVLGIDPYAVGALLELAQIHLAAREMESALGLAEKAAQISPAEVEPNLVLARVLSSRPEWAARGTAVLRALAERFPRSARVQSEFARLSLNRGDRPGAARAFERARELDPAALEPLVELVRLDLRAGNTGAAARRMDQAVAAHPSSTEVLLLAAELALTTNGAAAEGHLRRVIELDATNATAYQLLGALYIRQGKTKEARAEFTTLADRQPKLVEPPTMLGLLSGMEGNLPEAERWFERALQANPRAPVAANNLAWIYVERGDRLDTALQLAQIAHSEQPQNPEIKDTLGWAYYKKGLLSFSIRTLTDAVTMQPQNPVFHYHLGMAHAANSEDARARASLERALAISQNFPGAIEARQALQKLLY